MYRWSMQKGEKIISVLDSTINKYIVIVVVSPPLLINTIQYDIRCTIHADMSLSDLISFDGIIAVGGDGLFHEIVNGLLTLRTNATITAQRRHRQSSQHAVRAGTHDAATVSSTPTTTAPRHFMSDDDAIMDELSSPLGSGLPPGIMKNSLPPLSSSPSSPGPIPSNSMKDNDIARNDHAHIVYAKAAAAAALRIGHIPGGSTDAVACTLHGTRSAFSAAMRIALGDGVPLDVLRIDAADGTREFATCMARYCIVLYCIVGWLVGC